MYNCIIQVPSLLQEKQINSEHQTLTDTSETVTKCESINSEEDSDSGEDERSDNESDEDENSKNSKFIRPRNESPTSRKVSLPNLVCPFFTLSKSISWSGMANW